jgi:hypothetical protein
VLRISKVILLLHLYTFVGYTGQFISPSGISNLCGTVAGKVTPKESISIGTTQKHL